MLENVIQTFLQNGGAKPHNIEAASVPAIVIGEAQKLETYEHLLAAPVAIKESRKFDDLRGFVEYVNDYKGASTVGRSPTTGSTPSSTSGRGWTSPVSQSWASGPSAGGRARSGRR